MLWAVAARGNCGKLEKWTAGGDALVISSRHRSRLPYGFRIGGKRRERAAALGQTHLNTCRTWGTVGVCVVGRRKQENNIAQISKRTKNQLVDKKMSSNFNRKILLVKVCFFKIVSKVIVLVFPSEKYQD